MSEKLKLPDVTLLGLTTRDHEATLAVMRHTLTQIEFASVVYISDVPPLDDGFHYIKIPKRPTYRDTSVFWLTELPKFADRFAEKIMLVEHDGYPVRLFAWHPEFLQYDFIGSPFPNGEVGNNGFCMFSRYFLESIPHLNIKPTAEECHPCDQILFRRHVSRLVELGVKIAPHQLAFNFSINTQVWKDTAGMLKVVGYRYTGQFGFHGLGCIPSMKTISGVQVAPEHQFRLDRPDPDGLLLPPNLYSESEAQQMLVAPDLIYK